MAGVTKEEIARAKELDLLTYFKLVEPGNTKLTTRPAGGGKPHNNLPPYRSVHIWRRTA